MNPSEEKAAIYNDNCLERSLIEGYIATAAEDISITNDFQVADFEELVAFD
jgi:hypothetical protein